MPYTPEDDLEVERLSNVLVEAYSEALNGVAKLFGADRFNSSGPHSDIKQAAKDIIAAKKAAPKGKFTRRVLFLYVCAQALSRLMVPHPSQGVSQTEFKHVMETQISSAQASLMLLAYFVRKFPKELLPSKCLTADIDGKCFYDLLMNHKNLADSWVAKLKGLRVCDTYDSTAIINELNDILIIFCKTRSA